MRSCVRSSAILLASRVQSSTPTQRAYGRGSRTRRFPADAGAGAGAGAGTGAGGAGAGAGGVDAGVNPKSWIASFLFRMIAHGRHCFSRTFEFTSLPVRRSVCSMIFQPLSRIPLFPGRRMLIDTCPSSTRINTSEFFGILPSEPIVERLPPYSRGTFS